MKQTLSQSDNLESIWENFLSQKGEKGLIQKSL